MSLGDRMLADPYERNVRCSSCNRVYHQRVEDQATGFRMKDEDRCPYCDHINATSMSSEFFNSTMEEYNDRKGIKAKT